MKQIVWILFISLSLSFKIVTADQYLCDKATDELRVFNNEWKKQKEDQYLKLYTEAKSLTKIMRSDYDSFYNRFMSSTHSESLAIALKGIETTAVLINNSIGMFNPFKVAANRAFNQGVLYGKKIPELGAENIMLGISAANDTATNGVRYAYAKALISTAPVIGEAIDSVITVAQNVKEMSEYGNERKKGVKQLQLAIERLDGLVAKYSKEVDHSKYMINQKKVITEEFERIQRENCIEDEDSFNESDFSDINGLGQKFNNFSSKRDSFINERNAYNQRMHDESFSQMMEDQSSRNAEIKQNKTKNSRQSSRSVQSTIDPNSRYSSNNNENVFCSDMTGLCTDGTRKKRSSVEENSWKPGKSTSMEQHRRNTANMNTSEEIQYWNDQRNGD
jgi:hypothetical protein